MKKIFAQKISTYSTVLVMSLIASSAIAQSSDLIESVKQRAANMLPEADAIPNARFEYRNLNIGKDSENSVVICGEVRETSSTWTRFTYFSDDVEVEPFPNFDVDAHDWFQTECRNAINNWTPGQLGTEEQIRACHTASLYSYIAYQRARFDFSYYLCDF